MGRLLLGHSRTPEYSDVISLLTILTSETALVHKLLASSRVVHLPHALASNAFVDHHGDETNKHKAANDDSDDCASVSFVLLIIVVRDVLGQLTTFYLGLSFFKPLSLCLNRSLRGFCSGNFGSGLLTLDRFDLFLDVVPNFLGFSGAENVGAAG